MPAERRSRRRRFRSRRPRPRRPAAPKPVAPPAYKLGDQVATREAYGTALAKLGEADARVVALDADVKNSTFSDKFEKALPDRFYQNFIAEQVMVGVGDGAGRARRDSVPVDLRLLPDARRRFHPHGGDQQRRHQAGRLARRRVDRRGRPVADGARGSRDVPRAAELSPCCIRATRVSAERLVALAAYHPGPAYIRTSRPKTPVIYANDETFTIGGLKVLRESARRRRDGRRRRRDGVRGAEGATTS